jgi:quercetin dioxygenase-like cupin family protein
VNFSRRDLSLLLPAMALAQQAAAKDEALKSKTYSFEGLPEKTNGKNKSWQVLDGGTHTGYHLDLHITELGAGQMPHPPHHHAHEEMILIETGLVEVTISGKSERIGPGSVAFVASNEEHGWKNVGDTGARYFVLAFGR